MRIISVPKDNTTKSVSFERLIFLNPLEAATSFTVTTDKEDYEPGDKVVLDVNVGALDKVDDDEEYFASITVSDLSSYLQVPKAKLMPSLPAMTYLEKEIKQINGEVDEFQHSSEYIDALFDQSSMGVKDTNT